MRGIGIGAVGRLFQEGASSEELIAEAAKRREARKGEAADTTTNQVA